jgi:molybdate transport system permease protein
MNRFDWDPILLSLQLSMATTIALLALSIPLAWGLSRLPPRYRIPLHALVSMPLVLPPSVLGFYLLLCFSPAHFPARFLRDHLGWDLAFTFRGLVLGSMVFSLPFMVNPILSGFDALPRSLTEAAYVLGKSPWRTLRSVLLPNLRPAVLSGSALAFAHTLGEFGVVLMIGGKIPGETRVASVAIYDEVERLDFAMANTYAAVLAVISFFLLMALFILNKRAPGTGAPS